MSVHTLGSSGLVPAISIGGIEHNILHHGGALSVRVGGIGAGAGNVIAAGGVTANSTGTVVFSNSNSISFGLVGNVVTGSFDAALTDHTHSDLYILLQNSTAYQTSVLSTLFLTGVDATGHTHTDIANLYAGNNISLSTTANSTTISVIGLENYAVSWHSHTNYIPVSNSTLFFPVADSTKLLGTGATASFFYKSNSTLFQSTGNYLTTAALSDHTHGSIYGINITGVSSSNGITLSANNQLGIAGLRASGNIFTEAADTTGCTSGTITLYGGYNVTLLQANNGIWINGKVFQLDAIVPDGNTAGTVSQLMEGTMWLAGGSNITLSQNGSSLSIIGAAAGTGGAGTGFTSASVTGTDILGTLGTNGLNMLVPNYATVGGAGSQYAFDNSNGITFGTSGTGSTRTVTASYNSTQFFLNAFSSLLQPVSNSSLSLGAGYSSHTHGSNISTVTITGTVITAASASNGITLGVPRYITTFASGAASDHTHGSLNLIGGIAGTSASSGLTLSIPSFLTTAANSTHIHGSVATTNINATSASNGLSLSVPVGSVYFSNISTNNITFGSVTSGSSTTITAIAGGGSGAGGVGQFTLGGNVLGSSTASGSTIQLIGGNNITLSASGGSAIRIDGPQGSVYFTNGSNVTWGSSVNGNSTSIMLTAGGGTGGAGGAAIKGSGTYSQNTGTVAFANSNGMSFGLNTNGTMTASYTVPNGSFYFSNSNNIIFGTSSAGISTTVTASANIGGFGLIAGTQTATSGSVFISNSNNITFGMSNNSRITAVVNAIGSSISSITSSSGNFSVSANTAGLSITAPAMGYLYLANIAGFSFVTTINGMSTTLGISTN